MLFAAIGIYAQIPNGGFEDWTTHTGYETPSGIWTCFNSTSDGSFYAITKSADAHSGNYSIKISNSYPCNLSTELYKFGAVFTTSKGTFDLPLNQTTMFKPSIERSGHPVKLTGYYKFSQGGSGLDLDTMRILLSFYKNGAQVYSDYNAVFKTSTSVASWTQFTIDFPTYTDSEIDSLGIVINACQPWDGVKGNSFVLVDDLEFKEASTGIKEIGNSNSSYFIYPNPATNSFQIKNLMSISNISIIDLTGKLIISKEVDTNENVNVSFLKQGIYLVKVQTATGLLVVRLVKE